MARAGVAARSSMGSPADRREFDRIEAPVVVAVETTTDGAFSGPAVDLSLGGVRVRCSERPALGSRVAVSLCAEADEVESLAALAALVVRHTADGVALCFLQMPEGSYERMRRLLGDHTIV